MKRGAFSIFLHSHLPYCRQAGRWPHGEEWIHEAALGSYLPLLQALWDLREQGTSFRLAVGVTPVLADQLADQLVQEHLEEYLDDKIRRASEDVERFEAAGGGHLAHLARFFEHRFEGLLTSYRERFRRNPIRVLKEFQEEGFLEVATSAATHGYLPLLPRDSSIYGQLRIGVETYERHFGRRPKSIWLPECGYRPAYHAEDGQSRVRPGLEEFLAEVGLQCFFAEAHTVAGGSPTGKSLGEVIGPYAAVARRYVVPTPPQSPPSRKTTYLPYWVQPGQVAVLGRNDRTSMQVWSADHGYPGEPLYQDFHKRDGVSGLRYWRVTGSKVDLGQKEPYDPWRAEKLVQAHAHHFASLVEDLIDGFYQETGKYGIVLASFDTELFGHWWFEGVDWLAAVLHRLAESPIVELTTPSQYLEDHPPEEDIALPEGSWGQGGGHFTWLNVDTDWMWPVVHEAEARMEGLVSRHPDSGGALAEILNQAARELLLLESSDWPFLVTTGQAKEYAIERFKGHVQRFHGLADAAAGGKISPDQLSHARELYELDKVFPQIDYRVFASREG